jgi:hypothetical protein
VVACVEERAGRGGSDGCAFGTRARSHRWLQDRAWGNVQLQRCTKSHKCMRLFPAARLHPNGPSEH